VAAECLRAHVLDATLHQAGGGPNTSTALRPPKATEFDIACTTFFSRPTLFANIFQSLDSVFRTLDVKPDEKLGIY
jgi:hypothetical protein